MSQAKRTAVIMSGGQGERFWPQSRCSLPKQFLSLTTDGRTLFEMTAARMRLLAADEDIYVVTNAAYRDLVARQAPYIPKDNILCEPATRNTAPAIAFAAAIIAKKNPKSVMYVVPSDHIIHGDKLFENVMSTGAAFVDENNALLTLGIVPSYPETGYGYIQYEGEALDTTPCTYRVTRFVEKPDRKHAEQYLLEGNFLWNSGMFIWRCDTFIDGMRQHCPSIGELTETLFAAAGAPHFDDVVRASFDKIESISVDYALMEKAKNMYTIPAGFSWSDVGSWYNMDAVNTVDAQGNVTIGNVVMTNCENSTFVSNGRLVAGTGTSNIIVVETADAVLVCDKHAAQDVKKIVALLKERNMDDYL